MSILPTEGQHFCSTFAMKNKGNIWTTEVGERVKRVVYWKIGISEMDISEINTFDDVITDMSIPIYP
jgi:hypothetical protein